MKRKFIPGDMIKCIDNSECAGSLTVGKRYKVKEVRSNLVLLISDLEFTESLYTRRFVISNIKNYPDREV